ncbi:hypothetical protein ACJ77P_10585 [Syntrophus buswellii]|uniref:hypothetical protein n=1 Tax=Syntrophus buswellii TaxID=43774 RepID=UPI0038D50C79
MMRRVPADGFALTFERSAYQGVSLSLGMPISDTIRLSAGLAARGSVIRYDMMMLLFTRERVLYSSIVEKGSDNPLWKTYWQNP